MKNPACMLSRASEAKSCAGDVIPAKFLLSFWANDHTRP